MHLLSNLNENLAPIRERRARLVKDPDYVWDVLATGAARARERATAQLAKVAAAMKLDYRKKKTIKKK